MLNDELHDIVLAQFIEYRNEHPGALRQYAIDIGLNEHTLLWFTKKRRKCYRSTLLKIQCYIEDNS